MLASTIRVTTPLLFAALGGLYSERSGVVNIALEGKMLVGAFAAAAVALATHSPWLGAAAGAGAGALAGVAYALFVIRWRADQIVAGTAINFLAIGLPPFLCKVLYDSTGGTPSLALSDRFTFEPVALVALALLLTWFWMRRSRSGLWVQFAGEHPQALDAAGVGVNRTRWMAVLMGGVLAGVGGATLSISLSSSFTREMSAGRGFMALAALILGKWRPLPTAAACVLFGLADAMQIRLQGVKLGGGAPIPTQFIQILPYVVTILVLAGVVGQSRAPKALGLSFRKA
ncbi:MAG: ABC transporter permease [Bdellovibrionales bacterium]|nr:ABC transporter permease [Bdellovibrionales bacterium]